MISTNLKQGERVLELLQEHYPGYHPLVGVAKIAHTTEDPRLEFDCHKTLSRYIEPELKSVEVSQAPPDSGLLKVFFDGECEDVTEQTAGDGTPALESLERTPVERLMDLESLELDVEDVTILEAQTA